MIRPPRRAATPRCVAGRACRAARAALAIGAALAASACAPRVEHAIRSEGRLGPVRIDATGDSQAGLVFLFSGTGGWNGALDTAAERIARRGALVVGVDLDAYLAGLRASDDGCHYVVAEIEDLSHRLEREHAFARYRAPILAGVGAGAVLAYAALAQSPAATVDGAIGLDPASSLATRVPLCPGAASEADPTGGYRYGAAPKLPGFWWTSPRGSLPDPTAGAPEVPETGSDEDRLASGVIAALDREAPGDADLADLPIVVLPAAAKPTQMAVIYSGDGGWRDLDKDIAEILAREGTPVVGVDSLRYFWREKSPERVAQDLERILRHYRTRWGVSRALLVGYSFGAGVLPFAVHRLPPDLRADVVQVSLLGLLPRALFQISVSGWLGVQDQGRPVLPELEALDLARVQCFYGEEEHDTLCTAPELAALERIRTRGGHHFDGDYERLARDILDGAKRRVAKILPSGDGRGT